MLRAAAMRYGCRGLGLDIDDGASTDLSLDVSEYDPSPSADYQSWLLLQEAAG